MADASKPAQKAPEKTADSVVEAKPVEVYVPPPPPPTLIQKFLIQVKELLRGLFSDDPDVRQMTALFWLSIIGLFAALGASFVVFKRNATDAVMTESGRLHTEDEEVVDEKKSKIHYLGSFTLSLLHDEERKPENAHGAVNMMELEVYMECDSDATCEYIKKQSDRSRDVLLRKLIQVDREDALTRDGKRRLRESFIKVLNEWLPKGKVRAIYFSKVMVG